MKIFITATWRPLIMLMMQCIPFLTIPQSKHDNTQSEPYDVTIVGFVDTSVVGQIPVHFIECLKQTARVNFIASKTFASTLSIPVSTKMIIENEDKRPGVVCIFTDILQEQTRSPYMEIPAAPFIKIAYSMSEFEQIPTEWVSILNSHFDAVAVPDTWLVEVYKNSGVTIPIFLLPIALDLKPFLHHSPKQAPQKQFVFGTISAGKNAPLLINAFTEAFGTSSNIKLRLYSPVPEPFVASIIRQKRDEGFINIEYETRSLTYEQYIDYLFDVDCYVNVSLGEAFSLPTRQSLALGIPLILSDNSTLNTLCATGYPRCVSAPIPLVISSRHFDCSQEKCGYYYQCNNDDIVAALKDVHDHYKTHLKRAQQARNWVEQFSYTNGAIKKKYRNLVKPDRIIFGDKNLVTADFLMTNSQKLYEKYRALIEIPARKSGMKSVKGNARKRKPHHRQPRRNRKVR